MKALGEPAVDSVDLGPCCHTCRKDLTEVEHLIEHVSETYAAWSIHWCNHVCRSNYG